jgi:hypothetical protein
MLTNLLFYRFLILNMLAIAGMSLAWREGFVQYVYGSDQTGLTYAITALFVICWLSTLRRIVGVSRELNHIKRNGGRRIQRTKARKLLIKMRWMGMANNWLVGMGLLGTVIGFTIALGGVNDSALSSVSGTEDTVIALMMGMRVALNTTMAGAVFSMWNEVNQCMLGTAVGCMVEDGE